MGFCLRPIASRLKSASDTESLNPERSSRLGSREFAEILDLWYRTRARPRARTATIRSRRCWLGRSAKDRFDMAYSTGLEKTRAGTLSAHPGFCMPSGRKWARSFEWESNADEHQPACRDGVGRISGNGHPYPISAFAGAFSLITPAETKFYPLGCIPAQVKP